MATLNQIVEELADALNRPFDTFLKERLKLIVRHERSRVIRQSVNKDGNDKLFRQRYSVTVSTVDNSDSVFLTGGTVLRTDNKIAKPIRYVTDVPFVYVGAMDGSNSFIYCEMSELRYVGSLRNNAEAIRYNYRNGYIYVFVNNDTKDSNTITAFADYSATVAGTVKVTSNWHELSTGDVITIIGTTSYNGTFSVTKIDSNNFYITDTWVADDATGTFSIYNNTNYGLIGSITAVANYTGVVAGTVSITSMNHGLVTGNVVTISGTTDYNSTYVITKIDVDTFYITATWTSTQTGTFIKSHIAVEALYENPELIIPTETNANSTAGIVYNDDMEFPITDDLIQDIKLRLLEGELSVTDNRDKVKGTHLDNE